MRVIDRLSEYLAYKQISAYKFERAVHVANGYLKKQIKGKGSIGSDILIRIHAHYQDLDPTWLLTGKGTMISFANVFGRYDNDFPQSDLSGEIAPSDLRLFLTDHFRLLETAVSHKLKCFNILRDLDVK